MKSSNLILLIARLGHFKGDIAGQDEKALKLQVFFPFANSTSFFNFQFYSSFLRTKAI